MSMVESKPADVFAFAMLAMEVFTGKMPFDKQKSEAVVLSILRGSRPEMPKDAHAVGLTSEMWKLLESCWQQDPKKRPTMEEVVRRWQKFVVTECVQIALVLLTPPLIPFSIFYDRLRCRSRYTFLRRWLPSIPRSRATSRTAHPPNPRTNPEVSHQRRTSEAVQPQAKHGTVQPQAKHEAVQPQTKHEAVQPQTKHEAVRPRTMSEAVRLRTVSETVRLRTVSETISIRAEFVQPGTMPEVAKPQTESKDPPPSESFVPGRYLSKILMCRCRST